MYETGQGWRVPPEPSTPRRRRPVFAWVVVAINVLFVVWVVTGLLNAGGQCAGLTGDELESCEMGRDIGTGIGVVLVVFFWAAVDLILGVLFLVTRRQR
jgi:hypothetical protein